VHPSVHARQTPDKVAYRMAASGEAVTYRELDDAANRFAQLLRVSGLQAGDHIAILLENNVRLFEMCWGRTTLRPHLYAHQHSAERE